ncbi:Antibiotic efflux pump outer membrane protein ArpC precursor [Sedimentisphaera cyanobacteriorum]|uniref:Antibiotic efflux pump outer membrane protein ArpC n=1 Tax=Sedimentisphaera cyanobacteriorum TaxID=1940790 RepID=A0A1Q2HRH6_9BACT|nr:efflux transporter outer membrane subunit [Sedimentisphaera cyanobacteriorum]AQQ09941.1 Antibiotic efflux pump outer membrane protein ArpC precursor [Sedimentisphaera cyanobacteriorum]
MRITILSLLAAVFILAGCAVKSADKIETSGQIPTEFSSSGGAKLPEKWWQHFSDERLSGLIENALKDSFTIQAAYSRMEQARQAAVKAGAGKLPEVSYSAQGSRSRSEAMGQTAYSNQFSAGLQASYEIDLWKRIDSAQKAAEKNFEASRQDLIASKISLTADIAQTWYALKAGILEKRIIEEQVQTNRKSLETVRMQYRQGMARASDLHSQERILEAAQGRLINAEKNVNLLENQLAVLLGREPKEFSAAPDAEIPELPPIPEAGIPAELLKRRPDLISSLNAVRAADYSAAAAIARQYPSLTLTGSVSGADSDIEDVFDNWLGSIAAGLTGPLFDAGSREAEANRARAVLQERISIYRQNVIRAVKDVEDAIETEQREKEYFRSLQRQLEIAQKNTKSVKQQYINGQQGYIYLLNAIENQQELEVSLVNSRLNLVKARISLCRALAGGWEQSS